MISDNMIAFIGVFVIPVIVGYVVATIISNGKY